jgi:CBS domain-containing protein
MEAHVVGSLEMLLRRAPLSVSPEAAVREVLRRMCVEDAAEAVVVAPVTGRPLGILTQRDVVERVALPAESLDGPVAGVMTGGVVALPRTAGVHEARLQLARHRLRRLVVVDEAGRLVGVVSREDLYAVRRPRADDLIERIQAVRDEAALTSVARQVSAGAAALVDGGEQAGRVGEWIALLNDLLAQAAIDIAEAEFELPMVPWCWLAFGSEGGWSRPCTPIRTTA